MFRDSVVERVGDRPDNWEPTITMTDTSAARRDVYLDPGVVTVIEPAPDRRGPGRRVVAPGAVDALDLLRDANRIVVIAERPLDDVPELSGLPVEPELPGEFPTGSWFITNDPVWCEGDRPTGLRSILVGPRRPPARRPTLHCDIDARDLAAAAMEILVRETMA